MKHPVYREVIHGNHINLQVLSRGLIANTVPKVPYVVISINSPGTTAPDINRNPNRKAVLRLTFNDIESGPQYQTISKKDARDIANFVMNWYSRVDLIVVHCDAGLSRSAGVAAAIAKTLNTDKYSSNSLTSDSEFFNHYTPNMLVYRTTMEAIEEFIQGDPEYS